MFDSPTARGFGNTVDTATADAYPGELPSWNYSDVMKGLDQFMEMVPNFATSSEGSEGVTQADPGLNEALNQQTTDATDKSTAAKRRQYKNKLAQKRFRERQKARSDELEARVKATSARLEEMTRKQKSLEARNTMLEKLIDLDKQHTIVPHIATDQQELYKEFGFTSLPGPLAEVVVRVSHLKLTLPSIKDQTVAVSEFAEMSLSAYAKLHTEYVHQLGKSFATLAKEPRADDANSPVLQQLQQWAVECALLLIATAFSSPKALRDLYHCNFAEGVLTQHQLPDKFYQSLLVALDLTDSQVQDVLYLRQLFYGKRGQLARERQALLKQFERCQAEQCLLDAVVEWTQIADKLCKNAKEEYRTTMQFASAFHIGIYTTKQCATIFVYGYPWLPMHISTLEAIASRRGGEPSASALEQDTSVEDSQHAANWEDVVTYLTTLDMSTVDRHMPLLPQ